MRSVHQTRPSGWPVRGLSGEGGLLLSIDFPDDVPEPAVPPLATEDGLG